MDAIAIATIASATVELLAPYLKSLGEELAKKAGGEIGAKVGETALDKAKQLYEIVKAKFAPKPDAAKVISALEKSPNDEDTQAAVRFHLKEMMASDESFAKELANLLKEASEAGADTIFQTTITGSVQKLSQMGVYGDVKILEISGNVLIVSETAVGKVLARLFQSPVARDITDYIKVIVKSNRFGRKVQFQVPHDITVGAFIDLVVDILQLPWSKRIDELMLSFDFSYSVVFGDKKLPLNQSLRDVGISDGDEVQLFITAIWTDELEKEEQEMKGAFYMLTAEQLLRRENARKTRGVLSQSKIKSLADSCFAFIDEIGYVE